MPETRAGSDSFCIQAKPQANRGDAKFLNMCGKTTEQQQIFSDMRATGIAGQIVTSGKWSWKARKNLAAQTITVHLVTEQWRAARILWSDRPTVGTSISTTIPATPAGQWITLDIAPLLQAIASGTVGYGFRITTNATTPQVVCGLDSNDKPVLAWSATTDLDMPTDLGPDGGVIGRSKWVCSWTPLEDQVAFRVQVDNSGDGTIDWDSGEQPGEYGEYDLATSSFPGLSANASARWRVHSKSINGNWGEPSDWTDLITNIPQAQPVALNPAGGVIYDPTSVFAGHVDGPIWQWEIVVTDDTRTPLWTTGAKATADFAAELPEKVKGARLLAGDKNYGAYFRVIDRADRIGSTGDPAWAEIWVPFTFDHDAGVPAPTGPTVTRLPASPTDRLTWSRPATPDGGWVVWLADRIVARLDGDDVTQNGTSYQWDAVGVAPAWTANEWAVQAVENKKASAKAVVDQEPVEMFGTYLIRDTTGEYVRLDADPPKGERKDRVDSYTPLNSSGPVEIRRSIEPENGTLTSQIGHLDAVGPADHDPNETVESRVAMVRKLIREVPFSEPMRLAYQDQAFLAWVRDLNIKAIPEWHAADPVYDVTARYAQILDEVTWIA